jgi:hypothetical protein
MLAWYGDHASDYMTKTVHIVTSRDNFTIANQR